MPAPLRPLTWRTKSSIAGSGSGLMSWRTISDSASDGVLTMSRKSFGTHCRLAPPMITIRGAIAPPGSGFPAAENLTPASGDYPAPPSHGYAKHLYGASRHQQLGTPSTYTV